MSLKFPVVLMFNLLFAAHSTLLKVRENLLVTPGNYTIIL